VQERKRQTANQNYKCFHKIFALGC